jgi:hypothetical protein
LRHLQQTLGTSRNDYARFRGHSLIEEVLGGAVTRAAELKLLLLSGFLLRLLLCFRHVGSPSELRLVRGRSI